MKREFIQRLGWTLVVIWHAVGFIAPLVGGAEGLWFGIPWLIILVLGNMIFQKFTYDDSGNLIVNEDRILKVGFLIIGAGIVLYYLNKYLDG